MRYQLFALFTAVAVALPMAQPQNDGGFIDGQPSEAPNNQGAVTAPPPPQVDGAPNGGNDGGFVDGKPVDDPVNNTPIMNLLPPIAAPNGGNDGGFVDGRPVDPNAPAPQFPPITASPVSVGAKRSADSGAASSDSVNITPQTITTADEGTASCPGTGEFASECQTAEQAAPFVAESFSKYGITTKPEAAALLSLMLFESGGFKFNIHHFPGPNPGQGTRNMMNFPFVLEYAREVLPEADKAGLPTDAASATAQQKDDTLSKVLGNEFSFASAAWFYKTKCTDAVKEAVKTADKEGWTKYLTECVGTSVDGREEGWNKAKAALGA